MDNLIRRYEWGAMKVDTKKMFPHLPLKVIFHHYGFPEDEPNIHMMPFFEGNRSLIELQKHNIEKEALCDIKFHYVVAPDGAIYEGRDTAYMSKHLSFGDAGSIAILVWGNFNRESVPFEVKKSILELLRYLNKRFVTIKMESGIFAHSEKSLTSCPGHNLVNFIRKIKLHSHSIF